MPRSWVAYRDRPLNEEQTEAFHLILSTYRDS
ncbi:hypothetical protein ACUW97_002201 [Kocuria rhizophila]